jgi:hypothetical protein
MWHNEAGLAILFSILVLVDFVFLPLYSHAAVFRVLMKIFWAVFLFTGIAVISRERKHVLMLAVIPVIQILTGILNLISDARVIDVINAYSRILCFLLLVGLVLARVFLPGPVTAYRIVGSIAAFILLANFFAEIYFQMYRGNAGSFNLPATGFSSGNPFPTFLYFSFVTITTTGYGEITPVLPAARSVMQVEALIGILYPTILISRLVSGSIESKKLS